MEHIRCENVVIKKQRQCFCCLRVFPTKTKMNYWVGIVDGEFNATYSCMACVEIMNRYYDEGGYPEGFALEFLEKGETPEQLIERWNKG